MFLVPLILRRIKGIDRDELVLWVSISNLSLPLYRQLRPRLTCYHRLDDFGAMKPSLMSLEDSLEKIADIIFVASPNLQKQTSSTWARSNPIA
jgi:hypothetical protein